MADWFSVDCGHVRHLQNAENAIACVQDALKTGQEFRVAFDWVRFDSRGTVGLIENSTGLHEVDAVDFRRGTEVLVEVSDCPKHSIETISYRDDLVLSCLFTVREDDLGPTF